MQSAQSSACHVTIAVAAAIMIVLNQASYVTSGENGLEGSGLEHVSMIMITLARDL